jgi:hypothetical protein
MSVTLSLNINATQTNVRLSDALDARPGDLFRLGDEVVSFGGYQLRSHDRRSVVFHRGKSQTTAASHAGGTVVRGVADGLAASVDESAPDPFTSGAGGITVDNLTDAPTAVTTLVAPGALVSGGSADLSSQHPLLLIEEDEASSEPLIVAESASTQEKAVIIARSGEDIDTAVYLFSNGKIAVVPKIESLFSAIEVTGQDRDTFDPVFVVWPDGRVEMPALPTTDPLVDQAASGTTREC